MTTKQTYAEAEAQRFQSEIEDTIDSSTLFNVLEAIGTICHEKADHLRTNWQDDHAAKVWDRAGAALERLIANNNAIRSI